MSPDKAKDANLDADLKKLIDLLKSRIDALNADHKTLQELQGILDPASKAELAALRTRFDSFDRRLNDITGQLGPQSPGGPDLFARLQVLLKDLTTSEGNVRTLISSLSSAGINSAFGKSILAEVEVRMQKLSGAAGHSKVEEFINQTRLTRQRLQQWQVRLMLLAVGVPAGLGSLLHYMRVPWTLAVVLCGLSTVAACMGAVILGSAQRAALEREQELEDRRLMMK